MGEHMGVYTAVRWVADLWLSDAFVTKCFFTSFLLIDILLTSILVFLYPLPLFCRCVRGCSNWSGFSYFYESLILFWVHY